MASSLEHLKNIEYNGVRELARAAEHFLRSTGTTQEKGTVADYPNERTIRFYITEGLLDQAIKKRGVTSVFGYEHLLTLLAIKKLQSDGLPISVIKTLIPDKTTEELEALLSDEIGTLPPAASLFSDVQSLEMMEDGMDFAEIPAGMRPAAPPMAAAAPPEPKKNEAKEYLRSLLLGREKRPEPPARATPNLPPAQPNLPRGTSDWRRYEIFPGVELHISRSYRPQHDETFRQRLLVLIDGILQSRERR